MNGDDFLKKKLIDFEKEIKYFNREKNYLEKFLIFFKEDNALFIVIMLVLDFFYLFITLEETKVFSRNLSLTEILFSGFEQIFYVFLTNVLYLLFSHFLVNNPYTEKLIEKFERTSKPYEYYMNIFDYFEEYFYPEEYKEEFEECFEKHYRKDEENFKQWIKWQEITVKELYIKLLGNKELQKDIIEKIIKKSIVVISQNSKDEKIEEQLKLKKEKEIEEKNNEIKKIKNEIKEEIENYFTEEN